MSLRLDFYCNMYWKRFVFVFNLLTQMACVVVTSKMTPIEIECVALFFLLLILVFFSDRRNHFTTAYVLRSFLFVFFQQAEITRSYIRPPPNKTALDVPFNFMPDASTIHMNHQRSSANATTINNKSKHNPLAKFLLRISSPKSHENNSNNSTIANHSASSYKNNIGNHSSSSSSTSSSSSPAMTGVTSRHHHEPTTKPRSTTQTNLPPSYSESQLQYQQEQRIKFQSVTNPPSQICVSSLSLRTPPSTTSPNNISVPKINKSRSLCNEINYSSMSISTTPTAMINSIVNNTAIIGSTSATMLSPSSSSSTISLADETSAAASIIDLSSINQIEYSINALTDTDINCMVSSNRASPISSSQSNDV